MRFCTCQIAFLMLIALMSLNAIKSEHHLVTEIDAVLDECCKIGNASATISCTNNTKKIPESILSEFHDLCRINIEFCCQKSQQELNCQAGKKWARVQSTCINKKQPESFMLCCDACKMGQEISKLGGRCDRPILDFTTDQVKNDCCSQPEEDDYYYENEELSSSEELRYDEYDLTSESCGGEHECEHKCYVRGNDSYCECDEGYMLDKDGHSCLPITADELRLKKCSSGFKLNEFGECDDINECSEENACHKLESCSNTEGSYICSLMDFCSSGFRFNNIKRKCEDVDECLNGDICKITEECQNTYGSYNCRQKPCKGGYELNIKSGLCEDIDECLTKRCEGDLKCFNSPGSYVCDCDSGFHKNDIHPHLCDDIDECRMRQGQCEQKCYNTKGGFRCGCNSGYRLSSDNRKCTDINECELHGKALCTGTCKNTQGSYKCDCPGGFQLVRSNICVDINECKDPGKVCRGKNDFCLNTVGSFRCMKRECEPGYRYVKGSCYLMDRSLCYQNSNQVDGNCEVPVIYGFTFGMFVANSTVFPEGRGLYHFTMETKRDFDVAVKYFKVNSIGRNVEPAKKEFFRFEKVHGKVMIKLIKTIDGPQQTELIVWFHMKDGHGKDQQILGHRIVTVITEKQIF